MADGIRRWGALVVVTIAILAGIWYVVRPDSADPPPETPVVRPVVQRPECPTHDTLLAPTETRGFVPVASFMVPGVTSRVPEFHDCQRLVDSAQTRFGPLVAVFASRLLDSIWYKADQSPDTLGYRSLLSVGLVQSYDGAYTPLGIALDFNCLYVFDQAGTPQGVAARMVPVGVNEAACGQPFNPAMPGKDLDVRRMKAETGFKNQDYPPVARWDFDPRSGTHFIGIKCGAAWCEVGAPGFSGSTNHPSPALDQVERRVFKIKGWYDEQRLAIAQGAALVPGGSVGTIVPHPRLGEMTAAAFREWRLAARVHIQPHSAVYNTKFGYTDGTIPSAMNQVFLCNGPWATRCRRGNDPVDPPKCSKAMADPWYAKIVNNGGVATYKCVYRHDHSGLGITIPGTARWRWLLKDETKWMRCDVGCCQVDGET